MQLKNSIKLEETAMLAFGIYLFLLLDFEWWIFPVLFFVPDVSFLGYYFGNKTGAIIYNCFHHKGIALLIYLAGVLVENQVLLLIGVMLFSHSSFDRILGFGLKYKEGFKFTHLGKIGGETKGNES